MREEKRERESEGERNKYGQEVHFRKKRVSPAPLVEGFEYGLLVRLGYILKQTDAEEIEIDASYQLGTECERTNKKNKGKKTKMSRLEVRKRTLSENMQKPL